MDEKDVVFKGYSSGDGENNMRYMNSSHINRITTKSGKLGNTPYVKLFLEYYDVEFCVNSLFIWYIIEPVENDD